jgi:hypothetical protein
MQDSEDESISPLSKSVANSPRLYPHSQKYGYGSTNIPTPSTLESSIDNLSQINGLTETSPLFHTSITKYTDEDVPTPTLWKHEAKTIIQYSAPMTLTLLLQYSLTMSSIFVVGHLGKQELGAVSLANSMLIDSPTPPYLGLNN